jgi:O-antigen/teichoic acid export membrane protein
MADAVRGAHPESSNSRQQLSHPSRPRILEIARGGGIGLGGDVLGRALVYFYNFLLARAVGAEGLGLFTLALAVVTIASTCALLGLNQGIVRFGSVFATRNEKAKLKDLLVRSLSISLAAAILVALGLLALTPWLSSNAFDAPYLAPVLALLALTIPFAVVRWILLATTRTFKVVWMVVIVERLFLPLCLLLLTIGLLALGLGLRGLGIAHVASYALAASLAFVLLSKLLPRAFRGREPSVSTAGLLRFSLPLSLVSVIQFSYERTETILLGILSTAASVGIYNIALRTANFETMFVHSLSVIFSPFIADLYERKAMVELESLYKTTAQWSFTLALIVFLIFVMFSEPILGLFGAEFREGASVLVILGVGQLVNAATGQAGYMLVMTGHSVLTLVNTIVLLAVSAVLDVALIPRFGLLGAAIAGSVAIMVFSVLRAAQVYVILKMHPFRRSYWKPVAAGLLAISGVSALRFVLPARRETVEILLALPVFLSLYVLLIYRLGLEGDDRTVLMALQRRIGRLILYPRRGGR